MLRVRVCITESPLRRLLRLLGRALLDVRIGPRKGVDLMDFSPRVPRSNGRYPTRAVAGVEYTVSSPNPAVVSTAFATPSGSAVSPSGRLEVLRRSAQLLALVLVLDYWPDARIVDMTVSWLNGRVGSVSLGCAWTVGCELCEDNRVVASARPDVVESVINRSAEMASAYGSTIAYVLQNLGAPNVPSLAAMT